MADVIEYPGSKLFEQWGECMKEIISENEYSYGISSTIANDKNVFARMFVMGNTSGRMDLENDEISTNLAVQCETYSRIGMQKAFDIDAVSHKTMLALGFHRTYGPDITENADSKIIRIVSRYRRIYTGYFPEVAKHPEE